MPRWCVRKNVHTLCALVPVDPVAAVSFDVSVTTQPTDATCSSLPTLTLLAAVVTATTPTVFVGAAEAVLAQEAVESDEGE